MPESMRRTFNFLDVGDWGDLFFDDPRPEAEPNSDATEPSSNDEPVQ